jgi:hypothetical protein
MAISQLQPLMKLVGMSRVRFLYGLDQVPDDRLKWSPGGAALAPLALAGKTAGFLGAVTHMVRNRAMPERPGSPPAPPPGREEAKAAVDAAFGQLRAAIDALTEADLQQPVTMPWGETISLAEMLWSVGSVIGYHQGQLNYLQLAYGDTDPNMPPDWGYREQ